MMAKLDHLGKYDTFTLSYAGSLYLGRNPEPVFNAIKELASEGKLDLHNIKVKLAGNCGDIDGRPISQVIHAYGLDSVVEVLGTVSYLKALEIIRQSHVALLFAPDQPFQIPAKVYDYMGLGTRILALTDQGATRDLIRSTGAGSVFSPGDARGIKEFICRSQHNAAASGLRSPEAERFDRKRIAQRLAEELNRMIGDITCVAKPPSPTGSHAAGDLPKT